MIVFRVDSSAQIGSGHLMRCLTLAGQLKKEKQAEIGFVSRDLEGNLNHLIEKNGYRLFLLPKTASTEELAGYENWLTVKQSVDAGQTKKLLQGLTVDCLIIDSYALDEMWENIVRPCVNKIMVIDDLANRKHNCDILLDQNYCCDMDNRYTGLVPTHCQLLLGPHYALLREEFYEARKTMRNRDGNIKNILVFFGGSDLTNETMKALKALESLQRNDIQVNIVVGASNKNQKSIEAYCLQHDNMQYFCQVNNMAELMNEADLAIGAGGATTWERCFLGLPSIVIAIAENQVQISDDCNKLGIIKYIGKTENIDMERLIESCKELLGNKSAIKRMQKQMQLLFCNLCLKNVINRIK
ncbi:UDP-2,4-diacetamido-2,4,6-trideoxy-beta-L-altropyranose hydrolase [Sporomusa aerivorans]|uniref:UDP-2,4-diacetamido-2,4, 6-trideoxy-beta-L-altropyranose hydrolase n=1 Tax=Sporomusa aerivorans TaxID=204936 RepID=UPI00352A5272